ncbi:PKD domain-containing protein [Candidatus Acetothermia bacterium]|nr:PKD domain-containing protein [Candidatus Acetothermia bacterium]MBI3642544.1 PKD domain-containing protein [Candidatus Acetothermia bacterium]
MRKFSTLAFILGAIFIFGSNVWATCTQEPTAPPIFCVVPEIPVAEQIAHFELTDRLYSTNVVWEFGDGSRVSVLSSNTVEHAYKAPGRYSVKVWVSYSNSGVFDSITQMVIVAAQDPVYVPTPITSFDLNGNRRIDNDEFFRALDMWVQYKLRDLTFFKVMDAWIGQTLVVEGSSIAHQAQAAPESHMIYDLNGRLVASGSCSAFNRQSVQRKLSTEGLPHGVYLVTSKNCESGSVKESFALVR